MTTESSPESATERCWICGYSQDAADHCWRIGGHLDDNCGCLKGTLDIQPAYPKHYFAPEPVPVSEGAGLGAVIQAARAVVGTRDRMDGFSLLLRSIDDLRAAIEALDAEEVP